MGTATNLDPAAPAAPAAAAPAPTVPVSYTRESLESLPIIELLGDEALKKDPSLASFKGIEGLARSYASARKMIGADANQFLKIPTEATTPEELNKFYNTLGRPEAADGYVVPEGVAQNQEKLQITNEVVGEFRGLAHKLGLSNTQFQAVLDWYGGPEGFVAKDVANATTEFEASMSQARQQMQAEWGDKYDQNLELARSAMRVVSQQDESLEDLLNTPFMIGKGRLGDDPRIIRLFQRIGSGLREDELKDGRTGTFRSFEAKMTPAEAQAEIRRLQGDPEFSKKWQSATHPAHADAVAQLARLFEQAHPA